MLYLLAFNRNIKGNFQKNLQKRNKVSKKEFEYSLTKLKKKANH